MVTRNIKSGWECSPRPASVLRAWWWGRSERRLRARRRGVHPIFVVMEHKKKSTRCAFSEEMYSEPRPTTALIFPLSVIVSSSVDGGNQSGFRGSASLQAVLNRRDARVRPQKATCAVVASSQTGSDSKRTWWWSISKPKRIRHGLHLPRSFRSTTRSHDCDARRLLFSAFATLPRTIGTSSTHYNEAFVAFPTKRGLACDLVLRLWACSLLSRSAPCGPGASAAC